MELDNNDEPQISLSQIKPNISDGRSPVYKYLKLFLSSRKIILLGSPANPMTLQKTGHKYDYRVDSYQHLCSTKSSKFECNEGLMGL